MQSSSASCRPHRHDLGVRVRRLIRVSLSLYSAEAPGDSDYSTWGKQLAHLLPEKRPANVLLWFIGNDRIVSMLTPTKEEFNLLLRFVEMPEGKAAYHAWIAFEKSKVAVDEVMQEVKAGKSVNWKLEMSLEMEEKDKFEKETAQALAFKAFEVKLASLREMKQKAGSDLTEHQAKPFGF